MGLFLGVFYFKGSILPGLLSIPAQVPAVFLTGKLGIRGILARSLNLFRHEFKLMHKIVEVHKIS